MIVGSTEKLPTSIVFIVTYVKDQFLFFNDVLTGKAGFVFGGCKFEYNRIFFLSE